jgi:copper chaperone CopZ
MQLHFFEASRRRFNFLHLFEPESSRVSALREEALKMPTLKFVPPRCSTGTGTSEQMPTGTCLAKPPTQKKKPSCCVKEEPPACCSSGTCSKSTELQSKSSCCSTGTCSSSTSKKPERSSCCTEGSCADLPCCSDADELEPGMGSTNKNLARSTFVCAGICCSSEVPMIDSVLKPVTGIEKIMVNVPLKNVIIDHDPDLVSAADIINILEKNHFGATIKRDGGLSFKHSSRRRSRFFVDKICCASEIPAIRAIVSPLDGVSNVMINVTTKTVRIVGNYVF